jgi:hypothetical protein
MPGETFLNALVGVSVVGQLPHLPCGGHLERVPGVAVVSLSQALAADMLKRMDVIDLANSRLGQRVLEVRYEEEEFTVTYLRGASSPQLAELVRRYRSSRKPPDSMWRRACVLRNGRGLNLALAVRAECEVVSRSALVDEEDVSWEAHVRLGEPGDAADPTATIATGAVTRADIESFLKRTGYFDKPRGGK